MKNLKDFLNYSFHFGKEISIDVKSILTVIVVLIVASWLIKLLRKFIIRRLPQENQHKFDGVFSYLKWFIYIIIILVTLHSSGVNVTAIFAASAALLIGIGLALQTLFQDIISGMFILLDQSVQVGDIIEADGKIGRVEEIRLRTTRAVTRDDKIIIIPNHKFLSELLYNWTQNHKHTRDSVKVGVAYGTDVDLVKKLLLEVANENEDILKHPAPLVMYEDFGDSSLKFGLYFYIQHSFRDPIIKSDLRFAIDRAFRANNITMPFPQRDVHIISPSQPPQRGGVE